MKKVRSKGYQFTARVSSLKIMRGGSKGDKLNRTHFLRHIFAQRCKQSESLFKATCLAHGKRSKN